MPQILIIARRLQNFDIPKTASQSQAHSHHHMYTNVPQSAETQQLTYKNSTLMANRSPTLRFKNVNTPYVHISSTSINIVACFPFPP
jgi:fatty acid desaturase